jgi:hypothetical protein
MTLWSKITFDQVNCIMEGLGIIRCPIFGVTRVVWGGTFKFGTICVEI